MKTSARIGLTDAEARRFSLARLIEALGNPSDPFASERAAFEFEACNAASRLAPGRGSRIPEEVLHARRDLMSDDLAAGASFIGTTVAPTFIEALHNAAMTARLGADVSYSNLVGDVQILRVDTGAAGGWIRPGSTVSETTPATGAVLLNMKTVAATTDVDRTLLKQTAGLAERIVRSELALALGLKWDEAAICGSGVPGTPLGIIYQTGIGSVAGGDNGATPTETHLLKLEAAVAEDNAVTGTMGYLTNAKVVKELKIAKTNPTYGETALWQGDPANPGFGIVNGYRGAMSNQVPSTLTKGSASGTCSAIIFGNWQDLILARWGSGIDLVVDPFTNAKTGMVSVTAFLDCDVAVKRVQSFAAMQDVLTTS